MENGLKPFEIRDIDAGIQTKTSDLAMEDEFLRFPLTVDTKNWSFGKRKGITTRYGIMPVPGHNSKDNSGETTIPLDPNNGVALAGKKPVSLIGAEDEWYPNHTSFYTSYRNSYDIYQKRRSILGAFIVPQPVQPLTNSSDYPVVYWASIRDRQRGALAAAWQFDLVPSTVWKDASTHLDCQEVVSQYEATVGGGTAVIPANVGTGAFLGNAIENDVASFGRLTARAMTSDLFRLRRVSGVRWYANFVEHTYSYGYGLQSFVADTVGTSGTVAANPVNAVFSSYGQFFPTIVKSNEQKQLSCTVSTVKVGDLDYQKWQGSMNIVIGTTERPGDVLSSRGFAVGRTSVAGGTTTSGSIQWNSSAPGWTISKAAAGGFTYTAMHCETNAYSVSLQARLIAAVVDGKPIVTMFNRYLADKTETLPYTADHCGAGSPTQRSNDYVIWVSPCNQEFIPREYETRLSSDDTKLYTEKESDAVAAPSVAKKTCWVNAPAYVFGTQTGVLGMNYRSTVGVLEKDKTYEYAYSVYNGITGIESNVGVPAKFYCGAAGQAILVWPVTTPPGLYGSGVGGATPYWGTDGFQLPPLTPAYRKAICNASDIAATSSLFEIAVNMFAYRFYYREVGSFEWLFAGERSFADVYFRPYCKEILIGQADAVGLPGGQPGGYIDNSPLPNDSYLDVKSFAGKLWWIARDAVRFSSDNAFAYPVRNYISASSGEFRGAIVHYFPGQAEARGRLVVFGNKAMYDIRQTSEFQYTQVRVSASSQPQAVPVPDSNFIVAERSTHTAFSGRTAVVAEGALYFWGPSGIFRDDGVNLPLRVSDSIEPDLFDSYDKTKVDEFFAYYNKKSQEILFFYRPADVTSGELTKAWVYSTRVEDLPNGRYGAWSQYSYKCLVDWAQEVDLTGFAGGRIGDTLEVPRGSGLRTLIGVRASSAATVSRPYFHDDLCDCGDMTPGTEMMVKSVNRINATTVRLTFASDHNATILASVSTGSSVYIFGSQEYGKLSVSLDGIREVVSRAPGTLDIKDSSAFAGLSTLSMRSYFPVFFPNYHDVTCNIDTNFFAPYGVTLWTRFRYSQLLIQPVERRNGTVNATATLSWNCNHTLDTVTSKTVTVERLNIREKTTQVIFDMASPGMQAEGQGIEFRVNYQQLGPRWTIFSWTAWTQPLEGTRNLLTYQQ